MLIKTLNSRNYSCRRCNSTLTYVLLFLGGGWVVWSGESQPIAAALCEHNRNSCVMNEGVGMLAALVERKDPKLSTGVPAYVTAWLRHSKLIRRHRHQTARLGGWARRRRPAPGSGQQGAREGRGGGEAAAEGGMGEEERSSQQHGASASGVQAAGHSASGRARHGRLARAPDQLLRRLGSALSTVLP
jgi:hypothetical protein